MEEGYTNRVQTVESTIKTAQWFWMTNNSNLDFSNACKFLIRKINNFQILTIFVDIFIVEFFNIFIVYSEWSLYVHLNSAY